MQLLTSNSTITSAKRFLHHLMDGAVAELLIMLLPAA